MRSRYAAAVLIGSMLALPLTASEVHATTDAHAGDAHAAAVEHGDDFPHPTISDDGHWAGAMTTIILFLFLAAAVVGPVVRANMPEEVPPAHSHDEPPGASHHHGPGGTLAEEPHD